MPSSGYSVYPKQIALHHASSVSSIGGSVGAAASLGREERRGPKGECSARTCPGLALLPGLPLADGPLPLMPALTLPLRAPLCKWYRSSLGPSPFWLEAAGCRAGVGNTGTSRDGCHWALTKVSSTTLWGAWGRCKL